jgi:hypothetical protein
MIFITIAHTNAHMTREKLQTRLITSNTYIHKRTII